MRRNSNRVTIRDVASKAGVSVTTVSRVLNGKDDISEETLTRVQAVVRELGYATSLAARGMRSHRTNVIGLIRVNAGDSEQVLAVPPHRPAAEPDRSSRGAAPNRARHRPPAHRGRPRAHGDPRAGGRAQEGWALGMGS